jgi:UDP-glucose 4-epimerase
LNADITNPKDLNEIFSNYSINSVFHFAGLKSVSESKSNPIKYYKNNLSGTVLLLEMMEKYKVKKIIFSSSATVYGLNSSGGYDENSPKKPINVYGKTKLFSEELLLDLYEKDKDWSIAILRYFNPVGAHESGLIFENVTNAQNLFPAIIKSIYDKNSSIQIYGSDYQTKDGTCCRDYIHIDDLVNGHVAALKWMKNNNKSSPLILNLGSGKTYSVLEVIKCFEFITGKCINYNFGSRRMGDLAEYFANTSLAKNILNWDCKKSLPEMCKDALNAGGSDHGL